MLVTQAWSRALSSRGLWVMHCDLFLYNMKVCPSLGVVKPVGSLEYTTSGATFSVTQ